MRQPRALAAALLLCCSWAHSAQAQTTGLALECTGSGLSMTLTDRSSDGREFGEQINAQDCQDNETWTFNYTVSGAQSTDDLYLYTGSNCLDGDPPFTATECVGEQLLSEIDTTGDYLEIQVQDVVPSDCTGDDAVQSYFVLYENGNTSGTPLGYCAHSFDYDFVGPSPPTDLSGSPGSGGVNLSWSSVGSEAQRYYLYCASSEGGAADGDADADTDADSDAGADADADADDDGEVSADCAAAETRLLAEDFSSTASTNGTAAEVSGLSNGVTYACGLRVEDESGNLGDWSNIVCVAPSPVDDFFEVYREAGGGQGFCYVATVAYEGHGDHPDVMELRWLRDRVISRLPGGSFLIGEYYLHGPTLAGALAPHPTGRRAVRGALSVVAGGLRASRRGGAALPIGVALAVVLGACLSRRWRGGSR